MVIKYIIIIFLSVTFIRMIRWANRGIPSIVAGIVTGITCFVINALWSFTFHKAWTSWLLAIFESIIVACLMILFLDICHICRRKRRRPKESITCHRPKTMEAFATAMEDLSSTIMDVEPAKTVADMKNAEYRLLMANQLDAMTKAVKEWNTPVSIVDYRYKTEIERLITEGKNKGFLLTDVHLFVKNNRLRMEAYIASRYMEPIAIRNLSSTIKGIFGKGMILGKDQEGMVTAEAAFCTWYEEPEYYGLLGVASQRKYGSKEIGDSFLVTERNDQTMHICLSDGMGSGEKAAKESKMVVRLMDKLVDAGFETDTALSLLNSSLVVSLGETYATLDYAMLDMYEGILEITKIGAAASFLVRETGVEILRSKNPPAGAQVEMTAEPVTKALENGDFLVMVTDGVIEYLMEDLPEEYFAGMIQRIRTDNASVLARTLMDQVLQKVNRMAKDDMTILVVGIWSK